MPISSKGDRTAAAGATSRRRQVAAGPSLVGRDQEFTALETELAKVQWTKVENRDPVKAYKPS